VLSDNQLNLEKLKELLGQERIAPAEHYELNWAGKAAARREIQKTSSHTLQTQTPTTRPAPSTCS
jgi:adenine-specific DNA-methyltransferase